jgi:hypothetical protein
MVAHQVWRWILLRLARSPGITLVAACALTLPLLEASIRPASLLGAIDSTRTWAFPAGLIGVAAAVADLSLARDFLARLDSHSRLLGELGALALAAVYLQLPIFLGTLLFTASPADWGRSLPAILTADLHLAGVALVLLFPNFGAALRTSLFVAAVWLLPALCARDASLGRFAALVDPRMALRAHSLSALVPSLSAACSLGLTAYLLRTGSVRSERG